MALIWGWREDSWKEVVFEQGCGRVEGRASRLPGDVSWLPVFQCQTQVASQQGQLDDEHRASVEEELIPGST